MKILAGMFAVILILGLLLGFLICDWKVSDELAAGDDWIGSFGVHFCGGETLGREFRRGE